MKPCQQNRKLIAWLALDALDAPKAATLRDHIALCEGCRSYWEGLSRLTEGLASAAPDSDIEASESFHRRLAQKLRASESRSVLHNLRAWLAGAARNWQVALPAAVAVAIALLGAVAWRSYWAPSRPMPPTVVSVPDFESELAPTMANYRMVAGRSLEELSELLTRHGNRSLPRAPMYTISRSQPVEASF